MQTLGFLCFLAAVVCFIIALIKLFQDKGVLHGILGLICFPYAFIWGWMNVGRLNLRNLMLVWTLLLILSIILNSSFGGFYDFGTHPATS